ncbi:MAG TPA: 6-pyruvoyl-tetrahydropterin synthase-related protein [Terriglobales bacterium]|nr:6-pyruvoyl-tetrahydropterin synthase-related protein [Terriglobales bacterium]
MKHLTGPQTSDPSERQPLCGWPLLAISLSAFAVILPFFVLGIPSGHDFEFHLHSWMEVRDQWSQGIAYPHWAALAHYGYGEARFLFYPPASWLLGATLGAVLPWAAVPGAYVWLALTLSGCSMFLLARPWLKHRDAVFAACLFVVNPYHLVVVYWRSAFAELLAGAWLPLLLLSILELDNQDQRARIRLALVVAGAALTNAPASLLANYSLALLVLVLAFRRRSARLLWSAAWAGALGAALAAFYLIPVFYEQPWINAAQLLSEGVRPQDNYLFTRIADPDHNRFNLLISLVATLELILLAMAAFSGRKLRNRQPQFWWTLLTWAGISALLMFSPSAIFWEHLPWLRFVQFPWRWLLCLNVAFTVLVTLAYRQWVWRAVLPVALVGILWFAGHRTQPPWWDHAIDVAELLEQHESGAGYEGSDEYAPAGADPYNIKLGGPRLALSGSGTARFEVRQWGPERRWFTAEISQSGGVAVRLFNYPAWEVELDGKPARTETLGETGQMLIPMPEGVSRVQIRFVRTGDRALGEAASLIAAAGLLLWWRRQRQLPKAR